MFTRTEANSIITVYKQKIIIIQNIEAKIEVMNLKRTKAKLGNLGNEFKAIDRETIDVAYANGNAEDAIYDKFPSHPDKNRSNINRTET